MLEGQLLASRNMIVFLPRFGGPVAARGKEPVEHRQINRPFQFKAVTPLGGQLANELSDARVLPQPSGSDAVMMSAPCRSRRISLWVLSESPDKSANAFCEAETIGSLDLTPFHRARDRSRAEMRPLAIGHEPACIREFGAELLCFASNTEVPECGIWRYSLVVTISVSVQGA